MALRILAARILRGTRRRWSDMATRRVAETPAESDSRKAIAKSHELVEDSRQPMLDTAARVERSNAAGMAARSGNRPPVILQLGARDFSVLVWVRDEGETAVYRAAKDRIKAASTAAGLARKLQERKP